MGQAKDKNTQAGLHNFLLTHLLTYTIGSPVTIPRQSRSVMKVIMLIRTVTMIKGRERVSFLLYTYLGLILIIITLSSESPSISF